jgi:hypothetical protein
MNPCNTLLESYQQRVYTSMLAAVKHQIQHTENPMSATVCRAEAVHVDSARLHHHLISEVALEESEIGSTNLNLPIGNNCTDYTLYLGMRGGSGDYKVEGANNDNLHAIATTSQRQQATIELERFNLRTTDGDGYESAVDDDTDADGKEVTLPDNDASTQNKEELVRGRLDLGTTDVYRYAGENGDNADAHVEEEASQTDDESR